MKSIIMVTLLILFIYGCGGGNTAIFTKNIDDNKSNEVNSSLSSSSNIDTNTSEEENLYPPLPSNRESGNRLRLPRLPRN